MPNLSLPENWGIRHQLFDIVRVVPRVFGFVWGIAPKTFLLMMLLVLLSALTPAAAIWMTKVIIDAIVGLSGGDGDWTVIAAPVGVLIGVWLLQAICGASSETVDTLLGEQVSYTAQQRILEKAATLDVAHFESPSFYDQLHQASSQCDRIQYIAQSSISLLQSIVGLAVMAGLLVVLHPLAIAILVATALPRILVEGIFAKRQFDFQVEYVRSRRMVDYMVRLLTSRDSAKEVRVFRLRDMFVDRFTHLSRVQLVALRKMLMKFLKFHGSLDVLSLAGVASIWSYAVYQAVLSRITIGEVTLVLQAAQQGQAMLKSVVQNAAGVYRDALFAARFFDFLELDPTKLEGSLALGDTDKRPLAPAMESGLLLDDVKFKYPGSAEYVLRGVSFKIEAGKKVAIVGENGAGKTTLVKLLCRLYDPTHGVVQIDGRDYIDCPIDDLRRRFGIVFQDFFRYDLSAAENIGLGHVEAMDDRDRVVAAATKGGARKTVEGLPKGFDTVLGREFEEGVDLSGGEWQQLAISRAFMSDAEVLILDEPTAALDALQEHRLYDEFAKLAESRTVVFISHRFSTVRMADTIVVLENGVVAELGSHDELLAAGGKYATMFNTQASRYRSDGGGVAKEEP